jgi:hypothetical protein
MRRSSASACTTLIQKHMESRTAVKKDQANKKDMESPKKYRLGLEGLEILVVTYLFLGDGNGKYRLFL